jgi:glycosidase
MPVYPSPSQHGYDVVDFFDINPDYGDLADLQTLVDEAHARDMRVILDFVPSHLSNQNPIFADAYSNPSSAYSDWFVWTNENHTLYASFAGNEQMPRFNHFNPEVVDYLTEAGLYWIDLDGDGDYSDGIDGFRVDNATFPPQEFLVSIRQAVKSANPEVVLLGETWVHNPQDLSIYYQDQFDALFDFPLYETLQGNRDFNGDGLLAGEGFPVLLTSLLRDEAEKFPPEAFAVRFSSNHDTNRNATELKGDPDRLRLTAALLAGLPGPVMIYYGEEIGMLGQKGGAPAYDNYRREPMDWYADQGGEGQTTWFRPDDRWNVPEDGISVEEQEGDPDSLLSYYQEVLRLRMAHPALVEGDFEILELETSGIGPLGFVRRAGDEAILVIINFSSEDQEVVIGEFPIQAEQLIDLITGQPYPAPTLGGNYSLALAPASALYLSPAP